MFKVGDKVKITNKIDKCSEQIGTISKINNLYEVMQTYYIEKFGCYYFEWELELINKTKKKVELIL